MLIIDTDYPAGIYEISIDDNKFIIKATNKDNYKINNEEQKIFMENILSKIGQFGQRAAPLVGGTPLTRGATGAASSAISEATAQGYEMYDEPGFTAEAIRFVVGGLPISAATTFVTGKAGKFLKQEFIHFNDF